jgi:hypothetical protein
MKAEFESCGYVSEFSCQGGKRMSGFVSYTVVWLLFKPLQQAVFIVLAEE